MHIPTPADMPKRFCEAWNRYDARALAAVFFEDADFVNVTGKWWENREDIYKAHDFGLRIIFKDSHLEILRIKVKMLGDAAAVVHTHIRLTGQSPNQGTDAHPRETLFLFVVQKTADGWRCSSAQNTDIVANKQTNVRDADGELRSVNYKERIRLTPPT